MDDHVSLLAGFPASSLTLIHPAHGSKGDPSKTPPLTSLQGCLLLQGKVQTPDALYTRSSKSHPCHLSSMSLIICCRLNVCVPPQVHMLKPMAQCDGIRRCQVLGVKPSRMELMPFYKKRPQRAPLPLLLCEHTERSWQPKPGRGLSPEPGHTGALISDFQPPEP